MNEQYGANNPRAFAEAISIDAWRTSYDDASGEADLHIDVVFSEGRVGGSDLAPVRFRLSLRRAEVRVKLDAGKVLKIPPVSVFRAPQPEGTRTRVAETEHAAQSEASGKISANLSSKSREIEGAASIGLGAGRKSSARVTERVEVESSNLHMKVSHRRFDGGYSFVIIPSDGDRLDGQPWSANLPIMRLRDTKTNRKRGEVPEPRVEISCRREDLIIEDVQFTEKTGLLWSNLTRNKQVAVLQYIKDELHRNGFECGDLADPFSELVIADVTPEES